MSFVDLLEMLSTRRPGCIAALFGCDGSLSVTGALAEQQCELSLWAVRGGLFREQKPTKQRTAIVGGAFDVHWTISGPSTNHWLEIACPRHAVFRSPEFVAPDVKSKVALGRVDLRPEGAAKSRRAVPNQE